MDLYPTQLATFITGSPGNTLGRFRLSRPPCALLSFEFVSLRQVGGTGVVVLVGSAMSSRSAQRFRLVNSKVEGKAEGG